MNNKNAIWVAGLSVAGALGLWARFFALGESALAVDEYYLLASAHNVLAHGLPQFDCGGYYTRGLLHQYTTAGLMSFGMNPETAIRLPSAAAGLVSVAGAYLLARHVGGRTVAMFVAVLLLLSLWQVEFARFGRMYSLFQACTVFYALAAVKYFESGAQRYFRWMIALGAVALITYEGGALLAAFTVFAVILNPKRASVVEIVLALAVLAAAVALTTIDFRHLGAQYPYAEGLLRSTGGNEDGGFAVDLPMLPLLPGWAMATLVAAGVAGTVVLVWMYRRVSPPVTGYALFLTVAAWTAVAAAMASGLFLLAGLLLAIAILFGILNADALLRRNFVLPFAVCAALLAGIWIFEAIAAAGSGGLGPALRAVLGYPDFYNEVWRPWADVLPLLGAGILIVSAAAGVLSVFPSGDLQAALRYRLLLAATLTLLVAAVLSNQPYNSTRYGYFLYPLLLILLAQGAVLIWRRFVPSANGQALALLPVAVMFVFSNDFNLRHLLQVKKPEYLYRTGYSTPVAKHLYPRWDYRGVGQFLTAHATPADLVVTTAYPVVPYYSNLFDFVYVDRMDPRIWIVSACEGRRDLWSKLPLMYDPADLRQLIQSAARPIWLVLDTERYSARRPIEAELLDRFAANEVYRSIDGNLAVLRIPSKHRP